MSHALLQAWTRVVRRHGNERALVQAADGLELSFADLDERAEAWRQQQIAAPVAGRPVVFATVNGAAWFDVFLGLMKAGAVPVPVDAGEPAAAQRELARRVGAAFHWTGESLQRVGPGRRLRDPNVALIKLTSGSTGRPRALEFTAAQMLADGRQVTASMGIGRGDLNYALIPFGHSYGLGNLTIPLVAQAVPLLVGSAALPRAIAEDFIRWRPSVFPGVPTLWRALAQSDVRLPGLRLAISAGAPLAPEVAREFAARHGCAIHSFYGSSETGGIAFDRTGEAALRGEVGTAMRGVTLKFGPGQRLRVSSAAVVTRGNRRRVAGRGAWLMPDRATADARGRVTLLGRRGATAKLGGRRVDLHEVAERLRRLAGVREVWVGVSEGAEPVLGAALATERSAMDVRAALGADTAAWKIPKKIVVLNALPLTERGKTDARALRRQVFGSG